MAERGGESGPAGRLRFRAGQGTASLLGYGRRPHLFEPVDRLDDRVAHPRPGPAGDRFAPRLQPHPERGRRHPGDEQPGDERHRGERPHEEDDGGGHPGGHQRGRRRQASAQQAVDVGVHVVHHAGEQFAAPPHAGAGHPGHQPGVDGGPPHPEPRERHLVREQAFGVAEQRPGDGAAADEDDGRGEGEHGRQGGRADQQPGRGAGEHDAGQPGPGAQRHGRDGLPERAAATPAPALGGLHLGPGV
jgi:hypothetical protein